MRAPNIAGFDLHRPLGSGGMGQVWLGSREAVDGIRKQVAIKLVPSVAGSDRARRRFLDEARLSVLLRHSNIAQVFDVGIDGDTGFIVMEWVDGIDLAHATGQQLWPHHVVAYVAGELLQALDYAHNLRHASQPLNLVHRDISPHNVLLSAHGEVKLADFGIARSQLADATDFNIAGKWRYMAPEQLRGEPCGPAADLFAVGVLLHELLGGVAFRVTQADLQRRDPPPLSMAIPAPLEQLRLWLLAHDPAARPATARDALMWLRGWDGFRESSMELAQLCAQPRLNTQGVSQHQHHTMDGTATEAATGFGTATAPTRTALTTDKSPRRRRIALWTVAATLAVATAGTAIWKVSSREVFRGGCPLDANLDGTIDIIGAVSMTRTPLSSFDMVVIDGATGEELHRIPNRQGYGVFACSTPTLTGLLLADGGELWSGEDLNHPKQTGSDAVASIGYAHGNDPQTWAPEFEASVWSGTSLGKLSVDLGDIQIIAHTDVVDTVSVEASGTATWSRTFPWVRTMLALAANRHVVATIAIENEDGRVMATLVGLDPDSGETLFEVDLGERYSDRFLIATDELLLTDFGSRLVAIDIETGEIRWSVGDL